MCARNIKNSPEKNKEITFYLLFIFLQSYQSWNESSEVQNANENGFRYNFLK